MESPNMPKSLGTPRFWLPISQASHFSSPYKVRTTDIETSKYHIMKHCASMINLWFINKNRIFSTEIVPVRIWYNRSYIWDIKKKKNPLNKDLLYSIGTCTQYLVKIHDGKESEKEYTHTHTHTHTHTQLNHSGIHLKLTQHCKSSVLQFLKIPSRDELG